jgi:hypothetical protein
MFLRNHTINIHFEIFLSLGSRYTKIQLLRPPISIIYFCEELQTIILASNLSAVSTSPRTLKELIF